MRYILAIYASILILIGYPGIANAESASLPGGISRDDRSIINLWLKEHPRYRIASDVDCKCEKYLSRARRDRNLGGADYHPYYVKGDLNGDRVSDQAIGVIEKLKDNEEYRVLIIDGRNHHRAYLSNLFLLGEVMYFGFPRKKPYHLLIGSQNTEGAVLIPLRNGKYKIQLPEG